MKPNVPQVDFDKILGNFAIHPFVLAAIPPVTAILQAKLEYLPEEVWPAIFILEMVALVMFALGWVLSRDFRKAGLFTTVFLLMSFAFPFGERFTQATYKSMGGSVLPDWVPLLLYVVLLLAWLPITLKSTFQLAGKSWDIPQTNVCSSLNIAMILIMVLNLYPLYMDEQQLGREQDKYVAEFNQLVQDAHVNPNSPKPDIYYIIFDGYGNERTLKDMMHYDNTPFLTFLRSKGFYVVPRAASNYDRTLLSVSSSMTMQYVNSIPERNGKDYEGETVHWRMIQRGCVISFLKRLGYKIVNVASGAFATEDIPQADYNYHSTFINIFSGGILLLFTPLSCLETYVPILRDSYVDTRLAPDRHLDSIVNIPGPKFVLIHACVVHPPYIFDENGNRLPLDHKMLNQVSRSSQAYVSQLKFGEKKMEKWLDEILSKSKTKPVIVLQSDHGPNIPFQLHDFYNERMRIINAYYMPDGVKKPPFYDSITPVNSFRAIFNQLFDTSFKILPDRSYCAVPNGKPYSWSDVTNDLQF